MPENKKYASHLVTLKNLLSHTSGMTGFRCIGYKRNEAFPTLIQALNGQKPANTPAVTLVSKPDTTFLYSPAAYMVVEQVLEDISKQSFNTFMQHALLKPLSMHHSTFEQPLPDTYFSNLAMPYLPDGKTIDHGPLSFVSAAAGGLWTTSIDLSKFLRAFQMSLHRNGEGMMNKGILNTYLTAGLNKNWGLGMQVNLDKEGNEQTVGDYFGHSGWNSGYIAYMLASKKDAVGMAVFINTAPLMTYKGEVKQFNFIKALNKKIALVYAWQ